MTAMTYAEDVPVSGGIVRTHSGWRGCSAWVTYEMPGGWIVRVEADVTAADYAPVSVTVQSKLEAGGAPHGLTASVLRQVPMNDARKVLRRRHADALAAQDILDDRVSAYDLLPKRLGSDVDWQSFARAYARAVARNPEHPVDHIARLTGLSPNTIAARVRRAREMRLLEGVEQ